MATHREACRQTSARGHLRFPSSQEPGDSQQETNTGSAAGGTDLLKQQEPGQGSDRTQRPTAGPVTASSVTASRSHESRVTSHGVTKSRVTESRVTSHEDPPSARRHDSRRAAAAFTGDPHEEARPETGRRCRHEVDSGPDRRAKRRHASAAARRSRPARGRVGPTCQSHGILSVTVPALERYGCSIGHGTTR